MKKIIILMLLFVSLCGYSQITYTDSIRHITVSGYAGVLSFGGINVKNAKVRGYVSARIGGDVTYTPKPFVRIFGLAAVEVDETATVLPLFLLGAKFIPHKKVSITLGKIPTPMTELRPFPTTGAGQFETWTEARIPGSAYGGKITYSPNDKFSVITGGFWRGNDASVELGIKVPYTQIAGYYMPKSKSFGVAGTLNYKLLTVIGAYNHRKVATIFTCVEIPKTKGLVITSDIGFDPVTGSMLRGEWGVFKSLYVKYVGMLFGTSYNHVSQEVRAYFYIYTKK
jgi:hypothetical protein